ncbi:phosphatidate cytidylyltransferase, partial [Bradyrhizobium sp. UFLA 03-164]|nr:phosphatidate cytidylyltransferase [Bradyrhizobium uaiense]
MTEGEAASAAASEQPPPAGGQGARNLGMRGAAARVLAPGAIALAYIGCLARAPLGTAGWPRPCAEWASVDAPGR